MSIDLLHMRTAMLYAEKSKAIRKKVGAVIVTESGIILPGYNGTPRGTDNICEKVIWSENGEYQTETTLNVIHAELNCIMKAAREGVSVRNAKVYVTLSPCLACSAMIMQSGIKEVFYAEKYRDESGIQYMSDYGIIVKQLTT